MKDFHNDPLVLWQAMRGVENDYLKKITGKSYKGHSPNPTWIIQKITEHLGPIGRNWGFNVLEESIVEGLPHQLLTEIDEEWAPGADGQMVLKRRHKKYELIREKYHQVRISVWQIVDGERRTFESFGGTPMFYKTKAGAWITDEDAAKKSLTDAYVKAASWLGAAADLFLGLWDDKYQQPDQSDTPPLPAGYTAGVSRTPPASAGASGPPPASGDYDGF